MHSRGRRRPQGTYIGLCSEMQSDAQRRSSHVLRVTLPSNSVSCWHERSQLSKQRSQLSKLPSQQRALSEVPHSGIQHMLVHVVTVNHVWRDRRLVRERIAIGGLHVFALSYLGVHVVGPRRLMRRVVLQGGKKCTSIAQRGKQQQPFSKMPARRRVLYAGLSDGVGPQNRKDRTLGRSAWGLGP
jgi:hypothetical protein